MINLQTNPLPSEAATPLIRLATVMIDLALKYPGQPVAMIVGDDGELTVGVMSILDPVDHDWCLKPVTPDRLPSIS